MVARTEEHEGEEVRGYCILLGNFCVILLSLSSNASLSLSLSLFLSLSAVLSVSRIACDLLLAFSTWNLPKGLADLHTRARIHVVG